MEKARFYTLVKNKSRFGGNSYIRGVVSGMMFVICGDAVRPYEKDASTGDVLMNVECTCEQYDEFMNKVESHYPGLCEFNYKKN